MSTKGYALVTGASRGIGQALAFRLAGCGWNLILVALPETGLAGVASEIAARAKVDVRWRETDLTERRDLHALINWVTGLDVPLEILVNNAGLGNPGTLAETTPRQSERLVDLNVAAVVRLTHGLLPLLRRQRRAYLLNVASLAAFKPVPYMPVYSASKAFVLNFTLSLRNELRGTPVSASVLCPGGVMTNQAVRTRIAEQGFFGRISRTFPEQVAREAVRGLLRGRRVIVPGRGGKLLHLLQRSVPLFVYTWITSRRFVNHGHALAASEDRPEMLPGPAPNGSRAL